MYVAFPFQVNDHARSAVVDEQEHLKQLIEQVLFTTPGERVNRPEFGTGLQSLLFAPLGIRWLLPPNSWCRAHYNNI